MKQSIRGHYLLLSAIAWMAFTAGAAEGSDSSALLPQLKGKLVSLAGTVAVPANDATFGEPKYLALYFGAGWCGPCHRFTPDLVSFYNSMHPKHPEFQVVFVSHDEGPADMQQYMAEMHMPWPAMRYDAIKFPPDLNHYCGPGIPCLVLLDSADGHVISDSFAGQKYLGPGKVLDDLRHILEHGAGASSAAAASASPAHGGTPSSPSNTKWDDIFKKRTP